MNLAGDRAGDRFMTGADARSRAWLAGAPIWQLCALAMVASIVLFKLGATPNLDDVQAIARDPFSPDGVDPSGEFIYGSPLVPLIAHHLGFVDAGSIVALHLALVAGGLIGVAYLIATWVNDLASRLYVAAWFASPLAHVQVTWLGQPDPVTMASAAVVTVGPAWACGVGGLLLGFNHFEQGVFILTAAAAVRSLRGSLAPVAWAMIGLVTGRALLQAYFSAAGLNASRVGYVTDRGVMHFLDMWSGVWPWIVFSVYATLWVPLIVMWRRSSRTDRIVLAAAQVVLTVPVLVAADMTRVYALITWPIVVYAACWWADRPVDAMRWLPTFLFAAVFVPRVVFLDYLVRFTNWA